MMSGTRKLPPISTSSPREMTASRPSQNVFSARTSAAAQLFTTSASSAPVSSVSSDVQCAWRDPRRPLATSYSSVENPCATVRMASSAGPASGARPRLVCSTTPVALITGRSVDRCRCSSADDMARTHPASSAGAGTSARRTRSTTERTTSATRSRGAPATRPRTPSSSSSEPTAGRARRRSAVTASWPSSRWSPSGRASRSSAPSNPWRAASREVSRTAWRPWPPWCPSPPASGARPA